MKRLQKIDLASTRALLVVVVTRFTVLISDEAKTQEVKKYYGSGSCHCPGGKVYDRTSNFAGIAIMSCRLHGKPAPVRDYWAREIQGAGP